MSHDTHTSTSPNDKSEGSVFKWAFLIIASILLIVAVVMIYNHLTSGSDSTKHNGNVSQNQNSTQQQPKQTPIIVNHVEVDYTGEYDKIIEFPEGRGLSFENSTQPYGAINADNEEHFGNRDEDISSKFPGCKANSRMRFRSSNGKPGHITINVWI